MFSTCRTSSKKKHNNSNNSNNSNNTKENANKNKNHGTSDEMEKNTVWAAALLNSLFNPDVAFSNIIASDPRISQCTGNGNCAMEALTKGMQQIGRNRTDHLTLRRKLSNWALENPSYKLSPNLTVKQRTLEGQQNLHSDRDFKHQWNRIKNPGVYTDDFVLHIAAAYLEVDIWVWRTVAEKQLRLAQIFNIDTDGRSMQPQIHIALSGQVNSLGALDGHFDLLNAYEYMQHDKLVHVDLDANGRDPRADEYRQNPQLLQNEQRADHQCMTVDLTDSPQETAENDQQHTASAHSVTVDLTDCPQETAENDQHHTAAAHPATLLSSQSSEKLRTRCTQPTCKRVASLRSLLMPKSLCEGCLTTSLCCPACKNETERSDGTLCQDCYTAAHRTEHNDPPLDNDYAMAWTDGGRRNITTSTITNGRRKHTNLKDVGGWAFMLLCGRGQKYVGSSSLGPNSTNNIGEFRAIKEVIEQAVKASIKQLDIHSDSMLAVQYYEGTCERDTVHLAELFREAEDIAARNDLQFKITHVKAHADDLNNQNVDSMCTAAIKANDCEPRYAGPTSIGQFRAPNRCTSPRTTPNLWAKYQTFPPYGPLNPDVTPNRGVADLADDKGNVLHICPLCKPVPAVVLNNKKALLTHLRGQHHKEAHVIAEDIQKLFGIEQCNACELYYNCDSICNHVCRPGAVRRLRDQVPPPQAATKAPKPKQGRLMLRPSEITPELIDRLTGISYQEIFSHQARTIETIHHTSVHMWSSVTALLLEGIVSYAYGGVNTPDNAAIAEGFLKLWLLAPRLILSTTSGVAERSRILLLGTAEAFNYLYLASKPKQRTSTPTTRTPKEEEDRIKSRVSKFIESYDLSRAINALINQPSPEITPELIDKIDALHPQAEPEHRIPDTAPTSIRLNAGEKLFNDTDVTRVVKDLRAHAAPDMTGLRANHIKCIFRGRRELASPEMRTRNSLYQLLHNILQDPDRLGPDDFWMYLAGGKLSVITAKARPVGSKNLLLKMLQSINDRVHDKELVHLAGPAHLAGKRNGVLSAALMAQMEIDFAQYVVESDPDIIRCILTTDAKAAFQSASRKHCYEVLCSEPSLKERFAPFFAKTHKGSQRIIWPEGKTTFEPSSGFTQGDINASKLYTCNTAALVRGLQEASPTDGVVVAIIDDITLMGSLDFFEIFSYIILII